MIAHAVLKTASELFIYNENILGIKNNLFHACDKNTDRLIDLHSQTKMAILFGILFVGFGLFGIWRSLQLRLKGRFIMGTVTKIQTRRRRAATVFVTFKPSKKRTITFKAGGWTNISASPLYQVGSQVPVLYDPNNPTDAVVYNIDFMWLIPLAFFGLGAFVLYTELTRK